MLAKDSTYKTFECTKCILDEMARLAEKLKDQNKAIKYYNKNLDLFPDYGNTYSGLSELIIRTKNKKAADDIVKRLSRYNDSAFARITRISLTMYFDKKDKRKIEASIDSVESLLKDREDSAELELLRGRYYKDIAKSYEGAEEHFTNAMNLIPGDLYYIQDLLDLYEEYGEYASIEDVIKENISNYPKDEQPVLRAALALGYLGQGKLKEAFTEFKQLHESGKISCDEIRQFSRYLKKLREYNQYITKCKD